MLSRSQAETEPQNARKRKNKIGRLFAKSEIAAKNQIKKSGGYLQEFK